MDKDKQERIEPAKATSLAETAKAPSDADRLARLQRAMSKTDEPPPRTNIYVCEKCRGHVVTVDRDEGVTPFMIACRDWLKGATACDGMMKSSMYRVFNPYMAASHEWYRPNAIEIATLNRYHADHVAKGGLMLRAVAR